MKVYIETNFIMELVFHQQQFETCNSLLTLCETGKIRLVIPAYSLVEPNEKLVRQANKRKELQEKLDNEIRQLIRATPNAARIAHIGDTGELLIKSNEEAKVRFIKYRSRFLKGVEIIALTAEILSDCLNITSRFLGKFTPEKREVVFRRLLRTGAEFESSLTLDPQDGIVLASIMSHLQENSIDEESCFLNQNSKDFGTKSIKSKLDQYNCRLIFSFEDGLEFVQSRLSQ